MSNIEETEKLRKAIVALEQRANSLEKQLDKITGKTESYTPKTKAVMREGLPLDLYTRLELLKFGFDVWGSYPFVYYQQAPQSAIERSIDVYAWRDGTFTYPTMAGKFDSRAGKTRPQRDHLLIEVKQRRQGVQWVFVNLPTDTRNQEHEVPPTANAGFELKPGEHGLKSDPNTKDVDNAIAQLNQAYMPFYVDLYSGRHLEKPGHMRLLSISNGMDSVWSVLVTNANLNIFQPPSHLSEIELSEDGDSDFFTEVPWLVFRPEPSLYLRFHQEKVLSQSVTVPEEQAGVLNAIAKFPCEVHIVNFAHLETFFKYVEDPPRIEKISFQLSINGKEGGSFTIGE